MITIQHDKLRARFLSRLKTQERAYNKIGLYYTPRLFTSRLKRDKELKERLYKIYHQLIDKIEVHLENNVVVQFAEVEALIIEPTTVSAVLKSTPNMKYKLSDFTGSTFNISSITIDHSVSFYDLLQLNTLKLPNIKRLTEEIRQGKEFTKEQMRKEYFRVIQNLDRQWAIELIEEVDFLAQQTSLRLLNHSKNFSKGKKSLGTF